MKKNIIKIVTGVFITCLIVIAFAWKAGRKGDNKSVLLYGTTQTAKSNLDYIDPTIGGVAQLLVPTAPFINQPNQLIRFFPTRKDYNDQQIADFPLSVVSHLNAKVFSLKPWSGNIDQNAWQAQLPYDRSREVLHPWYFATYLTNNIKVEFTPGKKTGFFQFTFPGNTPKQLLFNVYSKGESKWSFNGAEITGMETYNRNVKVYMYGTLNATGAPVILNSNNQQQNGNTATGPALKSYISFPQKGSNVIAFKYALSLISEAQAKQNFEEEIGSKTFDQLSADAKNAWSATINRIQVEGGTEAQKRSFYTALYRCYERMVNTTEDGSYYSAYNKQVNKDARPFYVDDWAWDTYVALHPLRMIINPSLEEDMLQSYVRMYAQSGVMPTFPLIEGNTKGMNGFHSSILFLDAYRKGLRNFDMQKAYEGAKKNVTSFTSLPWIKGPLTTLDSFYQKNGYLPALKPGEKETVPQVLPHERRQAVAVTLANSYDDWAVAQMAKTLNKTDDYNAFIKRSTNYKNLWNCQRRFFLPKDASGNWIDINPKLDGGQGGRDYYDENNGWTYLWQVQQDIPSLINLMGGQPAFEKRLDALFTEDLGVSKEEFQKKFPDATGLVGQFSMGNEPSFFIPYLYNYAGAAYKTQSRIRSLLATWFKDNVTGIPGDEDGGAMSAFAVFSFMGFYQPTPGIPVYAIGSPAFSKVTIALPGNKQFIIIANNNTAANMYIQSAKLNGQVLNYPFFTHQQLMAGGKLQLEMGVNPNKQWGKNGLQQYERMAAPYK